MGNIPVLKQLPTTQDSPRVRLQPFATGAMGGGTQAAQFGALGGSMMTAGEALGKIGDRLLAEKEEADVRGAVAEYREEVREKLYGKNGILTRQGDNAAGATIEAQREADKLRSDYAKRFGTKRAAEAWDRFSSQDVDSVISRAAQHEAIQTRKATVEKGQAKIQSTIQAMIDARDSPTDVAKKEEEIRRDAAYLYGRVQGLPPEVVEAETKRIISSAHAAVIDEHLKQGERDYAYDYFKKHKTALEPDYVMSREAALKKGARKDVLLADAIEISKRPGSLLDKIDHINKTYKDADEYAYVRNMVEDMVRVERYERAAMERENEQVAFDAAYSAWKSGDMSYEVPDGFRPAFYSAMNSLKRQIASQNEVKTNPDVYGWLYSIARDDIGKFKTDIDLNEYVDVIDEPDLNRLRKYQRGELSVVRDWEGKKIDIIRARWNRPDFPGDARKGTATEQANNFRQFRSAVEYKLLKATDGDWKAVEEAIDQTIIELYGPKNEAPRESLWDFLRSTRKRGMPMGQWGGYVPNRDENAGVGVQPRQRPPGVSPEAQWDDETGRWVVRNQYNREIEAWDEEGRLTDVRS